MSDKVSSVLLTALALLCMCSKPPTEILLKQYAVSSLDGVITRDNVIFDEGVTSDGNGSLRFTAPESTAVRLYETGDIDAENATLIYRAKIRTEFVNGRVFLEMWCGFPGQGEFFSRNLDTPLAGTNDWSTMETVFFLQKGENPDNVKLNLVITGPGTAWIDDVRLIRGPLR